MRSKLFVPGSRPELFAKALGGDADALSFDLEDAVAPDGKDAARRAVAQFVASDAARAAAKVLIVRTNGIDTPQFGPDVAALAGTGIGLLNIPKVETAAALRAAVAVIARAEAEAGVDTPLRLLVNIETPRALANAFDIACASARVAGLQLGLADMFEPHGIARHDPANVHAAMFALRMAAARADVFAMDSAWAALDDTDGYAAEAAMARRLGYIGKTCVHPRQVPLANAAFAPSDAELAQARRIVDAAGRTQAGAFVVDGRMVDLPFLKRAQALVAAAP
ncbi:HpcH/HpaI aldolase/citrate lyase family protein [Chiayiivirga flava]|uniref:Citrate lyase subunit beta/citryl-CoA lyase n=1 Tax=Chiayiivirga flava TaxID=659595 RepID=A0A7W8D5I8_9GAMM|nr:CoA ester lyase [Chiayiivirga flava]MBB5208303.1 citrate lyase subunit beta/citryl-CoA lyase [Chiayiivirga flava]